MLDDARAGFGYCSGGGKMVVFTSDGAYKPRIILLDGGCGVGGWRLCHGWRWGYEMGITFHGPRTVFFAAEK